jgi:tRNA-dihydrouridine synthase C
MEGYKPPAHWEWIAKITDVISIPVVANGEIWSVDDYKRCVEISGCRDVMIGRGAIASPGLALQIKEAAGQKLSWAEVLTVLLAYRDRIRNTPLPSGQVGRMKQWLRQLARNYNEAETLFSEIRKLNTPEEISMVIQRAKGDMAPTVAAC